MLLRNKHIAILFVSVTILTLFCAQERAINLNDSRCIECHKREADAFENYFSSHSAIYSCSFCHKNQSNLLEKEHSNTRGCYDCHSEMSHLPLAGAQEQTCLICHEPHGTPNIYQIREKVNGALNPLEISFLNLEGRADYSFAELAENEGGENGRNPGAGICETCHMDTVYYNSPGTGLAHYTTRCIDCHPHKLGFMAGM